MEDIPGKRCDDVFLEELKEVSWEGNAVGFPAGITATVTQISGGKRDNIQTFGLDTYFFSTSTFVTGNSLVICVSTVRPETGKLSRRVGELKRPMISIHLKRPPAEGNCIPWSFPLSFARVGSRKQETLSD